MYSGIVKEIGEVVSVTGNPLSIRLEVTSRIFDLAQVGDSVSVSGACLTVSEFGAKGAIFDVGTETLRRTTIGKLQQGSKVNLESPLTLTTLIHGHIVQGHVDGVGVVKEIVAEGQTTKLTIEGTNDLTRYLVPKASIAIDGVSLTVGEVIKNQFSLYIIPKTLELTTFHLLAPGSVVNIEVDILAKYVERLFQPPQD